jgi:putative ABC transport system permease protein
MIFELRHSVRSLRRAPSLTAISMLTVALGVGAGTALFSVVKAVLLNPLPYPDPGRLMWVAGRMDARGEEMRTSFPDFDDWHNQNHSFTAMAAYGEGPLVAGGGEVPERSVGAAVTEDFFKTMGVAPALGRVFLPEEHKTGAPLEKVVIGYGLWQRAYGGDRAIVGRRITVLGMRSTVIGVMPQGFAFPAGAELWVSARALGEGDSRTAHNFWVVGRLRPGATVEKASQDIGIIARRLKQQYPGPFQTVDASVMSLAAHLTGSVRTPLLVLFGAVGLLLLIVCVNVSNLLLVRVTVRSRELAVRTALGAERRHLFGHLLVESLVLATAGGALGLLAAFWSMDLVRVVLPAGVPHAADVRIDGGVMTFALALTTAAGLLFGTLPSWRASLLNVHDVLKAGARGQTATRHTQRTQGALVISEVALSVVLLAGAGLLLESFSRLKAVDPGFRAAHVLAVDLSFPVNEAERTRLVSRYRNLLEGVRAIPGVEAAGTIKDLPLDPIQRDGHFFIQSQPNLPAPDAGYLIVSPGLMEALHIPLLGGRRFTERDSEGAPGAAIVSAGMARKYWPGRDPIGERIWYDSFDQHEHWLTIVGIAGDVRQSGLTEPAPAEAYVCYSQVEIKGQLGSGNLMVRAAGDPKNLIPAVRRAIHDTNPEAAASFRLMDDVLADATARQRFQMQVLGAFAALALILASVGLYGVLSYAVTSNRAAIGIRMALGAPPAEVFRLTAQRALWLSSAGACLGLAGCVAVRHVLASVVFGIGPSDPKVLALAAAVMLAVSLAACWFPARRAMRVDPVTALREE